MNKLNTNPIKKAKHKKKKGRKQYSPSTKENQEDGRQTNKSQYNRNYRYGYQQNAFTEYKNNQFKQKPYHQRQNYKQKRSYGGKNKQQKQYRVQRGSYANRYKKSQNYYGSKNNNYSYKNKKNQRYNQNYKDYENDSDSNDYRKNNQYKSTQQHNWSSDSDENSSKENQPISNKSLNDSFDSFNNSPQKPKKKNSQPKKTSRTQPAKPLKEKKNVNKSFDSFDDNSEESESNNADLKETQEVKPIEKSKAKNTHNDSFDSFDDDNSEQENKNPVSKKTKKSAPVAKITWKTAKKVEKPVCQKHDSSFDSNSEDENSQDNSPVETKETFVKIDQPKNLTEQKDNDSFDEMDTTPMKQVVQEPIEVDSFDESGVSQVSDKQIDNHADSFGEIVGKIVEEKVQSSEKEQLKAKDVKDSFDESEEDDSQAFKTETLPNKPNSEHYTDSFDEFSDEEPQSKPTDNLTCDKLNSETQKPLKEAAPSKQVDEIQEDKAKLTSVELINEKVIDSFDESYEGDSQNEMKTHENKGDSFVEIPIEQSNPQADEEVCKKEIIGSIHESEEVQIKKNFNEQHVNVQALADSFDDLSDFSDAGSKKSLTKLSEKIEKEELSDSFDSRIEEAMEKDSDLSSEEIDQPDEMPKIVIKSPVKQTKLTNYEEIDSFDGETLSNCDKKSELALNENQITLQDQKVQTDNLASVNSLAVEQFEESKVKDSFDSSGSASSDTFDFNDFVLQKRMRNQKKRTNPDNDYIKELQQPAQKNKPNTAKKVKQTEETLNTAENEELVKDLQDEFTEKDVQVKELETVSLKSTPSQSQSDSSQKVQQLCNEANALLADLESEEKVIDKLIEQVNEGKDSSDSSDAKPVNLGTNSQEVSEEAKEEDLEEVIANLNFDFLNKSNPEEQQEESAFCGLSSEQIQDLGIFTQEEETNLVKIAKDVVETYILVQKDLKKSKILKEKFNNYFQISRSKKNSKTKELNDAELDQQELQQDEQLISLKEQLVDIELNSTELVDTINPFLGVSFARWVTLSLFLSCLGMFSLTSFLGVGLTYMLSWVYSISSAFYKIKEVFILFVINFDCSIFTRSLYYSLVYSHYSFSQFI